MDLVILAAGMGSRFGGLKQLEPVDDEKNFILDYSIHDAVKAGFDRVVIVVRKEYFKIFEETIGKRISSIIPLEYAFQDLSIVPEMFDAPRDRVKPWGTAHALYCCKNILSDKFAVINADDFYGAEPFELIANFLKNNENENDFISAGFHAKNTLTENGIVKRGLFKMNRDEATGLVESEIERREEGIFATPLGQNNWKQIEPETLTSMTMFGFSHKLVDKIEKEFVHFFSKPAEELKTSEFLLVDVINDMIKNGEAKLKVKDTSSKWFGITYREDVAKLKEGIACMKNQGLYPQTLYMTSQIKNGDKSL